MLYCFANISVQKCRTFFDVTSFSMASLAVSSVIISDMCPSVLYSGESMRALAALRRTVSSLGPHESLYRLNSVPTNDMTTTYFSFGLRNWSGLIWTVRPNLYRVAGLT